MNDKPACIFEMGDSMTNVLLQSSLYFLSARILQEEDRVSQLSAAVRKYRECMERDTRTELYLWQAPLGLLLSLQLQGQSVVQFWEGRIDILSWYANTFLCSYPNALVLSSRPAQFAQDPAEGMGGLSAPPIWPWQLERFSLKAKEQLRLRLRGLRCTCSELLVFLGFTPMARLLSLGEEPVAGGTDLQSACGEKPALGLSKGHGLGRGNIPPTEAVTRVEREQDLNEVLALLDYHLYQLYEGCFVADMLHKDFRQGLRHFWFEYFASCS